MNHADALAALDAAQLYGILDAAYADPSLWQYLAGELAAGGVQILQIRGKSLPKEQIVEAASKIHPLLQKYHVPLIINDYPDVAAQVGAEGCHVGQDDVPVQEARRIGCPKLIVGKSTHSAAQADAALQEKPDYIAFGPIFQTETKPEYKPIGLFDFPIVQTHSDVPVFCIGGINEVNLRTLKEAGIRRVVIVSALIRADDPAAYARRIRKALA